MEIKLLREFKVCIGRRIELLQRIYQVDGYNLVKDVVHFGESVAILPLVNPNEIILLKQFRAPLNKWIIEIPAGRVEEGEDILIAANRELVEETGYTAKRLKRIASIYPSPGYSDEIIHIIVANDLKYVGERPEKSEIIKQFKMKIQDIMNIFMNEEIVDAKTLISLLLYFIYKNQNGN